MGNEFNTEINKDQSSKPNIINKKKIKNKNNNNNNNIVSEEFIIKFHHEQKLRNGVLNDKLILSDQRRIVFISLIGLYQTWHLCPTSILYSSIFILPLRRKWIYFPKKYKNEIKKSIIGQINLFKDDSSFNEFVCLLKWKDSQKLLFWMLDEYELNEKFNNDDDCLVAPFWRFFNNKLTNLSDPITKTKYNSMKFNKKWWRFDYKSKYNVSPSQILHELYFVAMKFKAIQEIIYQSNPYSLNPIISYNNISYQNIIKTEAESESQSKSLNKSFVSNYCLKNELNDFCGFVSFKNNNCCPDIIDTDDQQQSDNEGIWMISTDYNEYDLS